MVAIFNNDGVRDAGMFLSRQLEQVLPRVYERKYPQLRFANGEFLPVQLDLEDGADSIIAELVERVGESKTLGNDASDIPFADASITENRFGVVTKAIAIKYSVMELAAAQKSGRNIRGNREMAMRRGIEETMNQVGAVGDPTRGIVGLLNDPNIDVDSSITANYYDPGADADDLVALFTDSVSKIITSTLMLEQPETILIPVRLHEIISTKRLSGTDKTVKSFILENSMWIKDILPANEMANSYLKDNGVIASNNTKDSMFIYSRDPQMVTRHATGLKVMAPQQSMMSWVVVMYQSTTGAINMFPKSALRVELPTA